MTKIVVTKDSPRYQVIDEGSFVIDLTDLPNEKFLSLTDDDNFNGLINEYGKPI